MGDYVRKIVPYHSSETDAMEGWLEEQASEGLVLEKIDGIFATFRKAKRCHLRYRIDTTRNRMETLSEKKAQKCRDRIKQISELGWQYIPGLTGNLSIYKTEDLSQTELPPNPDAPVPPRASAYWGAFLLVIALCGLYIYGIWHEDFEYWLIRGFVDLLQLAVLAIWGVVAITVRFFVSRQKKKRKAEENFLNRGAHTAERARRGKVGKVATHGFVALVLLFGICNGWGDHNTYTLIPLANYDKPIPFPLLSEINKEEGDCITQYAKDPQDTHTFTGLSKKWAFFVPKRLTIYQDWVPDYLHPRSVQYRVNYYELRMEEMAQWMMEDEKKGKAAETPHAFQSLPAAEGVEACYARLDENQYLLLTYEKKYIDVYYTGKTDLRTCLPLFARYLQGGGRQGETETPA